MTLNDFPKEIVKDMYVLLENKGTDRENLLGAFSSEVEAFKIYKKVSHDRKSIVNANVIYANVLDMKVIVGYEEI